MVNIYESLKRIEKLYNCEKSTETAKLLNLPNMTFLDNKRKAEAEYNKLKQYEIETNPIKKEILAKELSKNNGKKQYANSLYQSFIDLAAKDNLNLNWVFYGQLPIKNNDEKIGKIVQNYFINEHLNDDSIAIPFFNNIKASAGNGYINDENDEPDFMVLPKSMVVGKNLNAIKVFGDSMSPNIKQDAVILIDLDKREIINNRVYAIRYDNEVFVKRLEVSGDQILLKSDNVQYNTIIAKKSKVYVIGQVVSSILDQNIE